MTLDELQKLCEEATPGPWLLRHDHDYYQGGEYLGYGPQKYIPDDIYGGCKRVDCEPGEQTYFRTDVCRIEANDAAFIAAARTYLPKFIELAREIEQFRWNQEEDKFCQCCNHNEANGAYLEKILKGLDAI